MSHEIPTPMNEIAGISEPALDFNLSYSEKNNSSDSLFWRGACRHHQRYSKIESGKME